MHRIQVHMRWNILRCKTVWNDFVDNVFFFNANQANFVFNLRKHTYTFNPCVLKSLEHIHISLTNTQAAEQRNEQARLRDRKKWLSILCALLLYYFFLLLLLLLVWVLNFKCMLWNLFIRDTLKAKRMQFRRTKQCIVYIVKGWENARVRRRKNRRLITDGIKVRREHKKTHTKNHFNTRE